MATLEQIVPTGPAKEYQLSVRRLAIDDDLLALTYLRAKSEGLLPYFFWQSPPSTIRQFLDWCNQQVVVGCFATSNIGRPDERCDLAGIGVISSIKERGGLQVGDSSELFFREFHLIHTADFAKLLLDWAFTEGKVDVLYGCTPTPNVSAMRFMRHCGYEFSTPVYGLCCWQGKPCDGVMSWLTKSAWLRNAEGQ